MAKVTLPPPLAISGGPKAVTATLSDSWPKITEDDIDAVTEVLREGKISIGNGTGPIGDFEKAWAAYTGAKFCLAQNNGTSTVHSALFGIGIAPGDEVIVPSYTWLASVMPILSLNAIPVFCEVDPKTLVADPVDIDRKISPFTKGILVVHLWGNPVNMDAVMAIARKHGLKVIEDASHAHGATYKGKGVGTIGDVGAFSLQGSKAIVAGEGGAVVTNDPQVYDRMLVLGHFGRIDTFLQTEEYRGCDSGFGWKYRAHPLAMAIANVQLKRLDEVNRLRKERWDHLMGRLQGVPGVEVTTEYEGAVRGGYYGTRIIYRPDQLNGLPIESYMAALQAEGVRVELDRYPLLHLGRVFRERINFFGNGYPFDGPSVRRKIVYNVGDLPVTEELHPRLLALPTFTEAPFEILDQYAQAFVKIAENVGDVVGRDR